MANELKHASQGTELTQSEFEGVGLHVFNSQATGDIVYASSSTQLTRLAKGADNTVLQMGGSNIPEWVSDIALNSASANEPLITITNTHADATGGFLKFVKDPASGQGADNDVMGTITWHGTDASNNAVEELARMEAYVVEADHGTEAGGIKFYVAENDAQMTSGLEILGVKDQDGEIDVNIGAGAASTTTIKGTLTMGTTATLTNAGLLSVTDQSNIAGVGTITSGTWNATDIGVQHGGTGVSTLTANGVLIGNGTSNVTAVDMTTKGHILIGDGSGNPQMLAIGSNTHVLTADSGETTGVKWASASGGISEADAVALILALG